MPLTETITWIPVSERLPEDGKLIMMCVEDSDCPICFGYSDDEAMAWFYHNDNICTARVKAWSYMPTGPMTTDETGERKGNHDTK